MTPGLSWLETLGAASGRFGTFLAGAAAIVRPLSGGRTTYASAPWETAGRSPSDPVGVDVRRAACRPGPAGKPSPSLPASVSA
ncbi:hypothetical protein GCM10010517_65530 [Streptosporangium fragile]|uniref:Uncharacterized protein n=1 Tax=Streptosporangium fragile TaxID=46186 RepID=A0ABN3W6T7_9ACTN